MTDNVLLAIDAPGGFYQREGVPVWPVRNARERKVLERMVATLGGTVELISEAAERVLSGPELVVGLGAQASEPARLYAHLTQRSSVAIEGIEELRELSGVAVVVTTFAYVSERLLDVLYDRDALTVAPGLIFSYVDEDLQLQVLARSAALYCRHAEFRRRRVDVNPTIDFGVQTTSQYAFVGGRAEPSEFREALSSNPALLTLHTHSDGIDAYLRKDLVLCPIESVERDGRTAPAPSCLLSGICHRCNRPMSEVVGSEVLLAPEIVRAYVLIYCACWGLYPPQGVQSPAFSLARRFLESFTVGALITSWEINIQTLSVTARLFHDVARGLPLGQALARHLSSKEARGSHHRLCLVGDPSIELSPMDVEDPLQGIDSLRRRPGPSERSMGGLLLLRMMARQFAVEGSASDDVIAMIADYETMLVGSRWYDPDLALRFRRELVRYLAGQDTMLSKCWAHFVDETRALPDKPPCSICGRRTIRRVSILRIPGAVPRRETMCPSCGSIDDSAIDHEISMTVDPDGWIRLHGDLPASEWCARITVERFFTRETYGWEWPASSSGEPISSFRVPVPWPVVPFRLSVIFLSGDGEFTVLGCLYRGSTSETIPAARPQQTASRNS